MLEKSQFRNSQHAQEKMETMQSGMTDLQLQMDGIEAKLETMKKAKDTEIDMIEEVKKLLTQQTLQ